MWTALMWSWLLSEVTAKPQAQLHEGYRCTESLGLKEEPRASDLTPQTNQELFAWRHMDSQVTHWLDGL